MKGRKLLRGTKPVARTRQHIKPVAHDHMVDVLLMLRDPDSMADEEIYTLGSQHVHERAHLDHGDLMERCTANDEDLEAVRQFAKEHKLEVLREEPGARTVVLQGSVGDVNRAFSTELHHYRLGERVFHSHEDELSVPEALSEVVAGIFGLDNRSVSRRPRFFAGTAPDTPPVDEHTKPPAAFTGLYGFPVGTTGKDQCIGILEFAGGFEMEKLQDYLGKLGVQTPRIVVREVGKGRNAPLNLPGKINPDIEVYMDIEIAASAAPDATIVVYFGEDTEMGWIETLRAAVFDSENRPSVLSISWGQAEAYWSPQVIGILDDAFKKAALVGMTVCCSSGDRGVYEADEPLEAYTVPYPASSPLVLACGGTRLETSPGGATDESVWNQSSTIGMTSGGGVSRVFDQPPFQADSGVPTRFDTTQSGRGIPDVAANASSLTGYLVWADDTSMSMGGTSAAAPLWAGLVACLNESLGRRIGYLTPLLYTGEAQKHGALNSIIAGDSLNALMPGKHGYMASEGWDACTGLGTPRGDALLHWLENIAGKPASEIS